MQKRTISISLPFPRIYREFIATSLAFLSFGWLLVPVPAFGLAVGKASATPGEKTSVTQQRIYRIMAVGDSITEGSARFVSYRYPLWEKLMGAGYLVEYVGSRSSQTPVGPMQHEGYSGKNAEFLAKTVPEVFKKAPADIVLLASGHNHSSEEQPVGKIIAATESMIRSFRDVNPKVAVLLAQVIPSGKLPKYAYLPQLNEELRKLALRLNTPQQPVIGVNLAEGFDWKTDTIEDTVHPNAQGADKIATHWFNALTQLLEKPAQSYTPKIVH